MRTLLALFLALPLHAGVIYEFTTSIEQPRFSESLHGRVWIDGQRYRADVVRSDGTLQSVISQDGDATALFLDPQKKTYSNRVRIGHDVRSGSLFLWPVAGAEVDGEVTITYARASEPVTIAGEPAYEHVIEARFRVTSDYDGAPVGGEYRVTARIATSDALPPLPVNNPLRTGYPEVDRKLDEVAQNVHGLVLRHDLEIVRTLEGGTPQVEKTRATVTKVERAIIADDVFRVPDSFAYKGPDAGRR